MTFGLLVPLCYFSIHAVWTLFPPICYLSYVPFECSFPLCVILAYVPFECYFPLCIILAYVPFERYLLATGSITFIPGIETLNSRRFRRYPLKLGVCNRSPPALMIMNNTGYKVINMPSLALALNCFPAR